MRRYSKSAVASRAIYECNIIALSVREFTAKQQTSASGRLIEKSNKSYFHKQAEESAPYRVPGTTKIKYTNKHGRVFTFAVPTSTLTHPQIYRKPFSSQGWREIDTSFCDLGDLEDDLPSAVDDVLRDINEKKNSGDNIGNDNSQEVNINNDEAGLFDKMQSFKTSNHTFSKFTKNESNCENDAFAQSSLPTSDAYERSNKDSVANASEMKTQTFSLNKDNIQYEEHDDLLRLQTALVEFCKEYVTMDCSGFVHSSSEREKNTGPDYDMYDRALKRRRHWLAIRRRFEDVRYILWPSSTEQKCNTSISKPRLTVHKMLDALIWVEAASTFRIRKRYDYDVADDEEFNAIDLHRELTVLSNYVREELETLREKSSANFLSERSEEEQLTHPLFNNPDKFIAYTSLCQKHNVPITSFTDRHCTNKLSISSNSNNGNNTHCYKICYDKINKGVAENKNEEEESSNSKNSSSANQINKYKTARDNRNLTQLEVNIVDHNNDNNNINSNYPEKCILAYIPQLHSLRESIRIIHLIITSGNVEENVTFSKLDSSSPKTIITVHYKLMRSLAQLCSHDIYSVTDALDNVDEKDLCTLMTFAVHLKECNSIVFNNKQLLIMEEIGHEESVHSSYRTYNKDSETATNASTSKIASVNYKAAIKHCTLTLTQFMETVLTRCKRLLHESKQENTCIINDDIDKNDVDDTMYESTNENHDFRQVMNSKSYTHSKETDTLLHGKLSGENENDYLFSNNSKGEEGEARIKSLPRNYTHVALSTPLPLVSLQKYSEHSHPQALVHYKIGLRYAPGLRHVKLNAHRAAELAELVDRYESSTSLLPGSSSLATNFVQHLAHRVNFGKNTVSLAEIIRLLPLLAKMMLTHGSPEIVYNRYDTLLRACATSIGVEMQIEQTAENITQLLDGLACCHFVPSSFKQVESVVIRMTLSNAFTLHQLSVILSSFVKLVGHNMVSHTLQKFAAARALKTIVEFDSVENNNHTADNAKHVNESKLTSEMLDALHVLRILRYCHYSMYPEIAHELSSIGIVEHAIESFKNNDNNNSCANERIKEEEETVERESNNACEELEQEEEETKLEDNYNSNNNNGKKKNALDTLETDSDIILPWWSYCIIGVMLAESAVELAMNASVEEIQMNREYEKLLAEKATKIICFGLERATSKECNNLSSTRHVNNKERCDKFYSSTEELLWTSELSDILIDVITCCAALGIESCEAIQVLIVNVHTLHSCCTPLMAISVLESLHELKINCEHLSNLYQKYIDEVVAKLNDRCKESSTDNSGSKNSNNVRSGRSRTDTSVLLSDDWQFIEQIATSSCVSVQARDMAAAILQKEVNRLASILYECDVCSIDGNKGVTNVYVSDDSGDEMMPPGEHLALHNKKRAIEYHENLMKYSNVLKLYKEISCTTELSGSNNPEMNGTSVVNNDSETKQINIVDETKRVIGEKCHKV